MAFATVNFFSKSLRRNATFYMVFPTDKRFPPDVIPPEKRPFQTLYLLHGVFGNYTDWIRGTRVQSLADARDLCVVMPSGDNKFYCDSEISGDLYGKFIGEELVEFTRDSFPLSRKREDTFIGGLSMGGFGAIVNGLRNPETFGRIVAFSSALVKDHVLTSVDEPGRGIFTRTQYMTMFNLKNIGDFEGSVNDYDALADNLAKTGDPRPTVYMACGEQDFLISANLTYRDRLLSLGYDVTWESWPGGHDWKFWDEAIEKALNWLPLGEAVQGIHSGNVGNRS
jgi:S-formylglutathione hydrolase FrmB